MTSLGESETVYTQRPIPERSRMIAAQQLPNLMAVLEGNRMRLEMESNGGAADM